MDDLISVLVLVAPLAPVAVALAVLAGTTATAADRIGRWGSAAAALPAVLLGALALIRAGDAPLTGSWWLVDAPGAVFLLTVSVVGAASAAVSPAWLRTNPSSRAGALGSRRVYWIAFLLFWATLRRGAAGPATSASPGS